MVHITMITKEEIERGQNSGEKDRGIVIWQKTMFAQKNRR